MKTKLSIYWDEQDPLPMGKQVEEAFNRVINFCPELLSSDQKNRPAELMSFNRVINGEFGVEDLFLLVTYTLRVRNRVAKTKSEHVPEVYASLCQASKNLEDTILQTIDYTMANLDEHVLQYLASKGLDRKKMLSALATIDAVDD